MLCKICKKLIEQEDYPDSTRPPDCPVDVCHWCFSSGEYIPQEENQETEETEGDQEDYVAETSEQEDEEATDEEC